MGVKTYTQLEVVEAGTGTGNQLINRCATHVVKDGGAPYIVKEISTFLSSNGPHGLPVLNETGEGLCGNGDLCDHFENFSTDDENDVSGISTSSGPDNGVHESKAFPPDGNCDHCSNSLDHADTCVFGSRDSVDQCIDSLGFSRENSAHSTNGSFEGNGDLFISDVLSERVSRINQSDSDVTKDETGEHVVEHEQLEDDLRSLNKALRTSVSSNSDRSVEAVPLLVHDHAQRSEGSDYGGLVTSDCDVTPTECQAHGDSGFSECSRLECGEQVTENAENEIYSEPECSPSDACVKIMDASSDQNLVQYQKTLKRKYNGIDHTVYELSPSDSFHSSMGENMHRSGGPASVTSSDGICRLAHSSGSLFDQQKRRSYRLLKPPASGSGVADDTGTKVKVNATSADTEPLMGPGTSTDEYAESIQTAVILAEVRRDYKPTAADRGTMYCAFGGITIVAAVVFVLIYFS